MSMRTGDGFLRSRWHWVVLGVAAATACAGVFVWFGEQGVDADAAREEARAPYAAPDGDRRTGVAAVDLADYQLALRGVRSPTELAAVPADRGSFLASEKRVHCRFCAGALPIETRKCPVCGQEQPEEEKKAAAVADSDGDGLTDAWEKKYGLNPKDPADAQADADGDLFTNAEEFAAKTDPKDPKDHPDYLDSLQLQLPLKQTFMPFHFTGVYKTPSGLKYQFKDPSRGKEYDRGVYSVLEGAEIGKSGFVATKYEARSAKKKLGGGMEKKVDVSVATVTRKADGKAVPLVIDIRKTPIDVQAKLVFSRGPAPKEFTVVTGETIDLNGERHVVRRLKALPKGAEVELENALSGKRRTITALEP